jgi:hypothetical protein
MVSGHAQRLEQSLTTERDMELCVLCQPLSDIEARKESELVSRTSDTATSREVETTVVFAPILSLGWWQAHQKTYRPTLTGRSVPSLDVVFEYLSRNGEPRSAALYLTETAGRVHLELLLARECLFCLCLR